MSLKYVLPVYATIVLLSVSTFLNIQRIFPEVNPVQALWQKQRDFINLGMGGAWVQKDTTVYAYIPPAKTREWLTPCSDSGYVHIKKGASFYYFNIPNMKDTIWEKNFSDTTTCYETIINIPVSGSYFNIPRIQPDQPLHLLLNAPLALWNVLMRPYPQQCRSPFLLAAAAENLFVLILIVLSIIYRNKNSGSANNIILFCFCFTVIVFVLTGLVTPVAGAIMRYKVPVMPFLLVGLFMSIDTEALTRRFSFLKKVVRNYQC